MKAAVYTEYGSPDVVKILDVDKPVPKDDEVLIKVRAASVNPADYHLTHGPLIARLSNGLRRPKLTRLGFDVAGEVEAVGSGVRQFKPGDAVFGSCLGAFAEYVSARESAMAPKPANVTFEQAAAVPVAAYTALQILRDQGHIQPGQKVLINGAAGGVGTFAVQLAKWLSAHVTGVCSARNVDMVRALGADEVIDYTRQDFSTRGERYDLIFDLAGNHSLRAYRRILNPKGMYIGAGLVSSPHKLGMFLLRAAIAPLLSWFVSQKMFVYMAKRSKADLDVMSELMTAGKVSPVVDRCFPLAQLCEAMRYLENGHARGKVIITI